MKKTIKSLLVFCMVFFGLVVLASCTMGGGTTGGEEPAGCTHEPGTSWRANEEEHYHVCNLCSEYVDNAAHTFGEWVVRQEPGVGTPGSKVKSCTVCKYYLVEEIPAIEVQTGETTEDTVVFAKVPADWTEVNCYYWHNEAGVDNMDPAHKTSWPGVDMTLVDSEENIWAFIVPAGTANVIFNNGTGTPQTVDIAFVLEANLYILSETAGPDGKYTSANVSTYEYEGSLEDINKYGTKEVVDLAYITVYVQLPASWPGLYLYYWGGQTSCGNWPGLAIDTVVDADNNVYSIQLPNDVDGVVLSNGLGGDDNQTNDIIPAEGVNAYIVTEGTSKDEVTPCVYADGVFTPVEVAPAEIVYYVRGSMADNNWGTVDAYKLAYDAATDTATVTITVAAGDQFKIAEASWNNATTISAANATFDAAQFADLGEPDHNISVLVGGTYVITVTGVSTAARTCTIVAAE